MIKSLKILYIRVEQNSYKKAIWIDLYVYFKQ